MLMTVSRVGHRGITDTVQVDAVSGDDAAAKAYAPGWVIVGIEPAPMPAPTKAKV
jgi:hypothetical protein